LDDTISIDSRKYNGIPLKKGGTSGLVQSKLDQGVAGKMEASGLGQPLDAPSFGHVAAHQKDRGQKHHSSTP
jgi:hypothetical protein